MTELDEMTAHKLATEIATRWMWAQSPGRPSIYNIVRAVIHLNDPDYPGQSLCSLAPGIHLVDDIDDVTCDQCLNQYQILTRDQFEED